MSILSSSSDCVVDDTGLASSDLSIDDPGKAIKDPSGCNDPELSVTTEINIESACSTAATLEPFVSCESNIIKVGKVPLHWDFDVIYKVFCQYGSIDEIRVKVDERLKMWVAWVIYLTPSDATNAIHNIHTKEPDLECLLVDDHPKNLDVFRPEECSSSPLSKENFSASHRRPDPPRWLIATSQTERCNILRLRNYLTSKIGDIQKGSITRFGRNSALVNAKSTTQSLMLSNRRNEADSLLKSVKPHFGFSYAKGVIFSEDLYDFDEKEILVMCPESVWKIFKVPRTSMIVLTFTNSEIPHSICIDDMNFLVRPYKPRPLQCVNCFGYGHASNKCEGNKLCPRCSKAEHGKCDLAECCVNCKEGHKARSKTCRVYKKEEAAVLKAHSEHISVGYAKKLLAKTKSYSDAVSNKSNNSARVLTSSSCSSGISGTNSTFVRASPQPQRGVSTAGSVSAQACPQPQRGSSSADTVPDPPQGCP